MKEKGVYEKYVFKKGFDKETFICEINAAWHVHNSVILFTSGKRQLRAL